MIPVDRVPALTGAGWRSYLALHRSPDSGPSVPEAPVPPVGGEFEAQANRPREAALHGRWTVRVVSVAGAEDE